MTTGIRGSNCLFRSPENKRSNSSLNPAIEKDPKEQDTDGGNYLLCRHCLQVISSPAERIKVQGSHKHTFANPQGIIYEIGCFKNATGCGYTGNPTAEYTWFRGFRWRVALCGLCLTHLGWLFMSTASSSFNGLILNRLVEPKKEI
ncbi:MAG: cereblon family protein [Desulfobacterales bacterium]|nr:cereblon family protein [Desulfobacterales bacterium]